MAGIVGTDNVICAVGGATFDTPAAGTGKTVTATGLTLSGTAAANYSLASNRTVAGRFAVSGGPFYDGTRTETSYSGRIAVMPQFALEPSISLAWVRLPYGDFNARLIASRFTYTPTTRLFVMLNVSSTK